MLVHTKNVFGLGNGINLELSRKFKNSQSRYFQMPCLINGFIEPHFGIRFDSQLISYSCFPWTDLNIIFGMPIIFKLYEHLPRILQLKVEVIKLFNFTTRDLNVTIDQSIKVLSFLDYIWKWRLELWELVFYEEFKVKGGITQRKMWELQTWAKDALKCVFYMWKILWIHE